MLACPLRHGLPRYARNDEAGSLAIPSMTKLVACLFETGSLAIPYALACTDVGKTRTWRSTGWRQAQAASASEAMPPSASA